jgi:hypothetical protein
MPIRAYSPRYNLSVVTGDFDGDAAGTVAAGGSIDTGRVAKGTLSALVTVDAETNTLTMTGKWQASYDGTTWVDVVAPNNAANVALATGTAGADAAVTKAIAAPDAVFGWMFARFVIVSGVATGAATDTYSISYCYRMLSSGIN